MSLGTYPSLPASPIGIGDLIGSTLKLFAKHWWQYLVLAIIPSVAATVVTALAVVVWAATLVPSMSGGLNIAGLVFGIGLTLLVVMLTSVLVSLYCTSVALGLAEGSAWGEHRTWAQASTRVRGVLVRVGWVQALLTVVGTALLTGVLAAFLVPVFRLFDSGNNPSQSQIGALAGTMLLILLLGILAIPLTLIWQTKFAFVLPVAALEHDRTGFGVYGRSWQMTKGHFWRILGYLLLAGLITQFVLGAANQGLTLVYSPMEEMFDANSGEFVGFGVLGVMVALVSQLLYLVLAAAVSMLLALFTFVLYIDVERRNRGEVVQPFAYGYGGPYPYPQQAPQPPQAPSSHQQSGWDTYGQGPQPPAPYGP